MKFKILVFTILSVVLLAGAGCGSQSGDTSADSLMPVPGQEDVVDEVVVDTANPDNPITTAPQTVTVNYTGSAFSPNSITIKMGDTVKFINTGRTAAVWPASNPHPTHSGLRGFDAGLPLDTGGTYSFTFTKTGTFGYHNHLNPSQTGTIIVK